MLVLSRKLNERVVIDGRIFVQVLRLAGGIIKLGITAPANVSVHRQEVYEQIQKNNREASTRGQQTVPKFSKPQPSRKSSPTELTDPPPSHQENQPPNTPPVYGH